MSPEKLEHNKFCKFDADIFSFAVILFQMYFGGPPFLKASIED